MGFADAAVVLSYLTRDVDSVLFYFDWIEADPTPLFGTNIGAALKSAMDVANKDDRPTRKLFLIVSDGEDYGSELKRAIEMARTAGFRVNCIGVGGDDPVPIPLRNPEGRETYLRDDAGRQITTHFSETTLRGIASATGGRYIRSTSGAELQRAISEIVSGERRILGYRRSRNTATSILPGLPLRPSPLSACGCCCDDDARHCNCVRGMDRRTRARPDCRSRGRDRRGHRRAGGSRSAAS